MRGDVGKHHPHTTFMLSDTFLYDRRKRRPTQTTTYKPLVAGAEPRERSPGYENLQVRIVNGVPLTPLNPQHGKGETVYRKTQAVNFDLKICSSDAT